MAPPAAAADDGWTLDLTSDGHLAGRDALETRPAMTYASKERRGADGRDS
jgi:hypothetical protein